MQKLFNWFEKHRYLNVSDSITFFYLNKRKNWFRKNFLLPVFDGFTHFGYPEHDLDRSENVCLFVCDKNFAAVLTWLLCIQLKFICIKRMLSRIVLENVCTFSKLGAYRGTHFYSFSCIKHAIFLKVK